MNIKHIINNIIDALQQTGHFLSEKIKPLWIIIIMWSVFIIIGLSIAMYVNAVIENNDNKYGELPSLQVLENPSSEVASHLYSADGKLLGKYFRFNRTPVDYQHLSQNMLDALLATEDIRFFEHPGIDMKGTFAIPWYLLKGDRRGSSTITQQLAKNLYDTRSEKYSGKYTEGFIGKIIIKTKEWITAVRLERSYTKQEIVSMYLNTVDFGSNSFGIKVASRTFFGKEQEDLKPEEAALLAGLLKAPSKYSPILNPENALHRRNTILNQMAKYDFISEKKCKKLKDEPIDLNYHVEGHNKGMAQYFRSVCSDYLFKWCKLNGYDLYGDGLKIYTTIDSAMQMHAEHAVKNHMTSLQEKFFEHWEGRNPWSVEGEHGTFKEMKGFLDKEIKKTDVYKSLSAKYEGQKDSIQYQLNKKRDMKVFSHKGEIDTTFSYIDSLRYYKHFLHAGFMSMDPRSGDIKAWVGGIDFKYFQYDHVKQGKRQPGSTFKPIVYTAILGEAGKVYSPCFKVKDAPVTFIRDDEDKPTWTPQNAGGSFSGDTMTLRQAMARSVNSITAYMMKLMGDHTPQKVLEYARKLGIESHLEPVPAMCLGTFDVSPYELISAYSVFANKGYYVKPRFITKIEDRYGNVIAKFEPQRKKVLSEEIAYTMLHMLMGSTEEEGGTALGLHRYGLLGNDNDIGAKTGTTQNYSDGWFMGVTPKLVSGVWVGGEHRSIHFRTMDLGQGARMAMPIWANYMKKIYADTTNNISRGTFEKPDDMSIELNCDKFNGEFTGADSLKENEEPSNFLDLNNNNESFE